MYGSPAARPSATSEMSDVASLLHDAQTPRDAVRALTQVESLVSKQVLRVAVADLQQVLDGGVINILGNDVHLLGLRTSKTLIDSAISTLGHRSPVVASLAQVEKDRVHLLVLKDSEIRQAAAATRG